MKPAPAVFRAFQMPRSITKSRAVRQTVRRDRPPSSVAVVIPCHNYGRFLAEAIESVFVQTHGAAEILVVDDGSTDDTCAVADSFTSRKVQYLPVKFGHSQRARKAGYEATVSEILCFLDADDRLAPDYLEKGMAEFSDVDVAIVYSDVEYFGSRSGRSDYPSEYQPGLLHRFNYMHTGCLVLREALDISRAIDVFIDDRSSLQDWLLWRRILADGWLAKKQSGVYRYRQHGASMTSQWQSWVDNAEWYFDRASLARETITLFIPLSGRKPLWPVLADFLDRQKWPHDQTRLMLMDTSQDDEFGETVRQWIARCDYSDIRYVRTAVAEPGLADQPRLQSATEVTLAMARIYNRMARETTTNYVWVLEDDVMPPDDVCERLLRGFDSGTASVSAAYRSRFDNSYVAWEHNQRKYVERGVGVQVVGGNGFGCVVIRGDVLRDTVFTATVDYPAYDNAFYHRLHATGLKAKIDWSQECRHFT